MTEQEIKAFLQKPEVIKYLKENIEAEVYLDGQLLAKDEDCI